MKRAHHLNGGLPDPQEYEDPVQFLRAAHAIVLERISMLEHLTAIAKAEGVAKSVAGNEEWSRLLQFFTKALPVHERDEEEHFFHLYLPNFPGLVFNLVVHRPTFYKRDMR